MRPGFERRIADAAYTEHRRQIADWRRRVDEHAFIDDMDRRRGRYDTGGDPVAPAHSTAGTAWIPDDSAYAPPAIPDPASLISVRQLLVSFRAADQRRKQAEADAASQQQAARAAADTAQQTALRRVQPLPQRPSPAHYYGFFEREAMSESGLGSLLKWGSPKANVPPGTDPEQGTKAFSQAADTALSAIHKIAKDLKEQGEHEQGWGVIATVFGLGVGGYFLSTRVFHNVLSPFLLLCSITWLLGVAMGLLEKISHARSRGRLIRDARKLHAEYVQAETNATLCLSQWQERVKSENERITATANLQYALDMRKADTDFDAAMKGAAAQYTTEVAELLAAGRLASAGHDFPEIPWTDPRWPSWPGPPASDLSPVTRIGELSWTGSWDEIRLPALLPIIGGRAVLVFASGETKRTAIRAIQGAVARLLATCSPNRLRLTLIDPQALGENVAPFMTLADYDQRLVGPRAWTKPSDIARALLRQREYIEKAIQRILRDKYATVTDYETTTGKLAPPSRLLVVFDFPTNFTEDAIHTILQIIREGPRCGVHTIILADTAQSYQYRPVFDALARLSTQISWQANQFVWQDSDFRDCHLCLDPLPPADLLDQILRGVGRAVREPRNQ